MLSNVADSVSQLTEDLDLFVQHHSCTFPTRVASRDLLSFYLLYLLMIAFMAFQVCLCGFLTFGAWYLLQMGCENWEVIRVYSSFVFNSSVT